MPSRFDFVPMVCIPSQISAVPTVISQHVSPLTHVADHDVKITIVVDISESRAPASPLFSKNVAGKHPHEMAGPVFQEQWRFKIFHVG